MTSKTKRGRGEKSEGKKRRKERKESQSTALRSKKSKPKTVWAMMRADCERDNNICAQHGEAFSRERKVKFFLRVALHTLLHSQYNVEFTQSLISIIISFASGGMETFPRN